MHIDDAKLFHWLNMLEIDINDTTIYLVTQYMRDVVTNERIIYDPNRSKKIKNW